MEYGRRFFLLLSLFMICLGGVGLFLSAGSTPSDLSKDKTVFLLISENPKYSKFAEALRVTGLFDVLKDEEKLTIFVVSDEALSKEKPEIRKLFDQMKNSEQLKEVLLSQIVQNIILADDLVNRTVIAMNGKTLSVTVSGSGEKEENSNPMTSFSLDSSKDPSLRTLLFNEQTHSNQKKEKSISIEGAKIVKGDMKGSNGVVHEVSQLMTR